MNRKTMWIGMFLLTCLLMIFSVGTFNTNGNKYSNYVAEAATKKQFELSDKQYKKVKGLWSENSSGGWNVKFTRSKVNYYDRSTGELAWTATIKKCKKIGSVYAYYVKSEKGYYEYRTTTNDSDTLEYYGSWNDEHYADYYSGSSSLSRSISNDKTVIYSAMGNRIETFKVSKGKLILQSKDHIEYWNYGDGYDFFNTNELNAKRVQFQVSNNCQWTYSFVGDPDNMKRGKMNYKKVKEMVDNTVGDDMGYMQLCIYVKNKKVIRVNVQTE